EAVDQARDDRGDGGAERIEPSRGEHRRDESPGARVLLAVHLDDGAAHELPDLGVGVRREGLAVAQDAGDVVVAGDDRALAVVDGDAHHGLIPPHLGEHRVRVRQVEHELGIEGGADVVHGHGVLLEIPVDWRGPRVVDARRRDLLRRPLRHMDDPSAHRPPAPDVIAIRPGEEIDGGAVGRYLAGRLPGASGTPEIWQFPGGHANLTYLLRYPGKSDYVLRRPPHGDLPAGAHDMGREYRVLSKLYRVYRPAP